VIDVKNRVALSIVILKAVVVLPRAPGGTTRPDEAGIYSHLALFGLAVPARVVVTPEDQLPQRPSGLISSATLGAAREACVEQRIVPTSTEDALSVLGKAVQIALVAGSVLPAVAVPTAGPSAVAIAPALRRTGMVIDVRAVDRFIIDAVLILVRVY
jgi:hypothetical protein